VAIRNDQSRAAGAVARTPGWACLVLALASYFALHPLAMRPQTIVMDFSHLATVLPGLLASSLAESLQYAVPLLCLLGVPLAKRIAALESCAEVPPNAMSASEFALLTGEA